MQLHLHRASRSWGSLWQVARSGQGQALGANGDAAVAEHGSFAQEIDNFWSTCAIMSWRLGSRKHSMKEWMMETILWQELQLARILCAGACSLPGS